MLESKAQQIVEDLALKVISTVNPLRIVVGLSGGADSTLALLVAVQVTKVNPSCQILAVHCIHGLDADDPVWLKHCQNLCHKLKVELVTPRLNIVYGNGRSPEEVSRSERYKALLANLKGGILMLGHQADDQTENFLLAMKRGAGPRGLSGMRLVVNDGRGTIVRPLLGLKKKQIEDIITALGFDYVYDISNSYLKFERNFIRLKVLPLLRERFKGVDDAIARSAELCAQEHELAMRLALATVKSARCEKGLDINRLPLDDEPLCLAALRCFLQEYSELPPDYSAVKAAYNLCKISPDQHGLVMLEKKQLRRYRNLLCVITPGEAPPKGQYPLKIGESLKLGDYLYRLHPADNSDDSFYVSDDGVLLDFSYSGSLRLHPKKRNLPREIKKLMGEYQIPQWERASKCLVKTSDGLVLAFGDMFAVRTESKDKNSGQQFSLVIERK